MEDEVELSGRDGYEIIPVTPLRKMERRLEDIEKAGNIPQLQNLINQIIELMRSNQRIVEEIVKADVNLRSELSTLSGKLEETVSVMRNFMDMVRAAGEAELVGTASTGEPLKPLADQLQRMNDTSQKVVEGNQAILESLDNINKKMRGSTPVSQLLGAYPKIKLSKDYK